MASPKENNKRVGTNFFAEMVREIYILVVIY